MLLRSLDLYMAVTRFSAVSNASFPLCRSLSLPGARRWSSAAAAALKTVTDPDCLASDGPASSPPPPPPPELKERGSKSSGRMEWKILSSKELGIKPSMIPKPTRAVLNGLRKQGYDVYLVGGCVRDLVLKRIPKDFDVITTADLRQVKKTFSQCNIIGRRFPICHVHINNCIVEVSSFNTLGRKLDHSFTYVPRTSDCDEHDYARWKNCLGRDFTINGLMFDPFSKIVYDYLGGMEDIKRANVRTVIPAHISFQEDCARILRGIRIAARLGFKFSKETAYSVKDLASSVFRLDKGRILMEMNYMLGYGSAENSLRLLWKYGVLELLLPIQAAYFVSQGFQDGIRGLTCYWLAILAFHQALVRQSRDPLVVATYTLALHNGGNLSEAVDIAWRITHSHDASFPEFLEPRGWNSTGELISEVLEFASSVGSALSSMMDEHFVSQAMARYPQAPYSDLVFIPLQLYLSVCRMLECVKKDKRKEIS